jgi:hypothetical protein
MIYDYLQPMSLSWAPSQVIGSDHGVQSMETGTQKTDMVSDWQRMQRKEVLGENQRNRAGLVASGVLTLERGLRRIPFRRDPKESRLNGDSQGWEAVVLKPPVSPLGWLNPKSMSTTDLTRASLAAAAAAKEALMIGALSRHRGAPRHRARHRVLHNM